jgi:hypothetical protein
MKKISKFLSFILLCGLILTACTSAATQPPEPQVVESAATQAPATQAPATQPEATSPAVVQPEAAPAVQHTDVPGTLPTSEGKKWGDQSTISSINKARALGGDRFTLGRFERPYNANTMDVYFPQLDIDRAVLYPDDPTWVYVVITMVGRDANNAFSGKYAIELDLDRNGHGDILIQADQPAAAEWDTKGVRVNQDSNLDVGGIKPFVADSAGAGGNGYENILFDQGTGDDPDLAWVRLDPADSASFQIAFKKSLLAGNKNYTASIWAGTNLDPFLFDYNDHFTHEQAGAADSTITNFYPIKGLSELDNTCRQAINYDPSESEPGVCISE